LKVGYGLASEDLSFSYRRQKNPRRLALLLRWADIRLPGIVGLAEPLFRLLTGRARRKGIDKELEARYRR
jgi:hypothetical protein